MASSNCCPGANGAYWQPGQGEWVKIIVLRTRWAKKNIARYVTLDCGVCSLEGFCS